MLIGPNRVTEPSVFRDINNKICINTRFLDKISKYNLLKLLNKKYFNGKKTIKPIKQLVSVNRTLTTINMSFNKKLWVSSDYGSIKSISQMIDEI